MCATPVAYGGKPHNSLFQTRFGDEPCRAAQKSHDFNRRRCQRPSALTTCVPTHIRRHYTRRFKPLLYQLSCKNILYCIKFYGLQCDFTILWNCVGVCKALNREPYKSQQSALSSKKQAARLSKVVRLLSKTKAHLAHSCKMSSSFVSLHVRPTVKYRNIFINYCCYELVLWFTDIVYSVNEQSHGDP